MIEVTDEMLKVARSMQSFELMIKRIIELHEQSKPKPEPVGWAMCRFEHIFETNEWAEKYREDWNMHDEPITPIYTTPPTQEPLTKEQRGAILKALSNRNDGYNVDDVIDETEKAHGIGVTNE